MCEVCTGGALAVAQALAAPVSVQTLAPRGLQRGAPRRVDRPPVAAARAELLFSGGPILTMADRPGAAPAEAVAVRDGKILAVGSREELDGLVGPETRRVELDGRALLPGLIDPHMHLAFVYMIDWVDIGPTETPTMDGVLDRLRGAIAATPAGEWVRGRLFDPSITRGAKPPTLAELDALAPDHPLFVLEGNGHLAYVNSLAYAAAGVDRTTPDPPTARFGRDTDGELDGRLEESAAYTPFLAAMPRVGPAEVVGRIRDLTELAASVGCTSLHDCGIGLLAGAGDLEALRAVMAGDAPVRYRGMLVSTLMDTWEELGLRPGFGDDRFRVQGIKAWSDGSNQGRTGYQREPYLGGGRGHLNYTAEALTETVRRAHRGGWQVGVHANGDAAIDVTLDAYAEVLAESPRQDHRHRIEHCSILHPDQMTRMAELGVSPSFLIGHIRWWGRAFRDEILGPDRALHYDPCASALAAGLRISLHSDWNVTPIEPLRYVEDAVRRILADGGEVLAPDERIPVEAALRAVTVDAAWQCQLEGLTGSLEVGKAADLTLLEADPRAVAPTSIASIAVSETWLDGERRHGA